MKLTKKILEKIIFEAIQEIREREMLAPNLNTASLYAALVTDDIGPQFEKEQLAAGLEEVVVWLKEKEELTKIAQEIVDIAEEMYPDKWDEVITGLYKLVK
jgi:acyl CoA:acetate/3-ketoacid CoA transferase beta subunit|tara:strand:+ start:2162 stop:2464 length:303 start_codon:yes stop_codon:yes gene_type:complete